MVGTPAGAPYTFRFEMTPGEIEEKEEEEEEEEKNHRIMMVSEQ